MWRISNDFCVMTTGKAQKPTNILSIIGYWKNFCNNILIFRILRYEIEIDNIAKLDAAWDEIKRSSFTKTKLILSQIKILICSKLNQEVSFSCSQSLYNPWRHIDQEDGWSRFSFYSHTVWYKRNKSVSQCNISF